MCISFVYINNNATENTFQLVIINNRDEYYNRPTKPAHFWNDHCISGLDDEPGKEGGTWFGASKFGKIGFLLNIFTPNNIDNKQGRGHLVRDFLIGADSALEYSKKIDKSVYNPFNLVLLEKRNNLWTTVYTNASDDSSPKILQSEFLSFGNSAFEEPWKKVTRSEEIFKEILTSHGKADESGTLKAELIRLLKDDCLAWPDPQLISQQDSSMSEDIVKKLGSNFVNIGSFGTRTHTMILIDWKGSGEYQEITLDGENWITNIFPFELNSNIE